MTDSEKIRDYQVSKQELDIEFECDNLKIFIVHKKDENTQHIIDARRSLKKNDLYAIPSIENR